MPDTTSRPQTEDLEHQMHSVRDDLATLARLMKEIGESKAGAARNAAMAEATALLERSRAAVDEGRQRARGKATSIEDYIQDNPVQSTLIALGVGLLIGLMNRR